MCSSLKVPDPVPPPPPPPPPKPVEFGSANTMDKSKKASNARKSLSIPLSVGGTEGGTGLSIPQ